MPGVCPRCRRDVYFAEEKLALGRVFHTFCFTCRNCRKLLDSCTVTTHSGELFCKNCYTRLFPPTSRVLQRPKTSECPATTSQANPYPDSCADCYSRCTTGNSLILETSSRKQRLRGGGIENGEEKSEGHDAEKESVPCEETECSCSNAVSAETNYCDCPLIPPTISPSCKFPSNPQRRLETNPLVDKTHLSRDYQRVIMLNAENDLTERAETKFEIHQEPTERRYDIWRADSPGNEPDGTYVPTCEELENRAEFPDHATAFPCDSSLACRYDRQRTPADADFVEQRMRGGCGGGCAGCTVGATVVNYETDTGRFQPECCGTRREPDNICPSSRGLMMDVSRHQQPVCCSSKRRSCCSEAGEQRASRLCRPPARCRSPCTAAPIAGCGGGGCCGGGCRGGCGKPGQQCMPARPCTMPPCVPRSAPTSQASPCAPPRPCAPQPPCCRPLRGTPDNRGRGRGPGCCRSYSPRRTAQEDCCHSRVPPGCECLGGGLDCQRCGRKVYQAEMQIASGVPYHNICFSCFCCRKPLEPLTYQENCGEIYCKQCYVRNFGPQGYGYGIGAGVLQTPM